ncbi:MAG: chromate transporter, partial [Lachnospiraceae bacterium]|nr:chromate transporter [Lachnospiraceae bacterium]
SGLKPAVIGLIAAAFVSVSKTVFFSGGISVSVFTGIDFWIALCIFILTAVLSFKKKVHPIVLIVLAAALGIIAGFAKELLT